MLLPRTISAKLYQELYCQHHQHLQSAGFSTPWPPTFILQSFNKNLLIIVKTLTNRINVDKDTEVKPKKTSENSLSMVP